MPRPPFGKLREVWSTDDAAARLIEDYRGCAQHLAESLEWKHPGGDFEPLAMEGLYLAAFTWDPERGTFYARLQAMVWSRCCRLVEKQQRWKARFHRISLDDAAAIIAEQHE